jgi:hypothetical protein
MELLRGARRWVVAQLTQMSRSGALPCVSEHSEYIESDCEQNEEEEKEEEEAEDRQDRPAKRAAPEASNVAKAAAPPPPSSLETLSAAGEEGVCVTLAALYIDPSMGELTPPEHAAKLSTAMSFSELRDYSAGAGPDCMRFFAALRALLYDTSVRDSAKFPTQYGAEAPAQSLDELRTLAAAACSTCVAVATPTATRGSAAGLPASQLWAEHLPKPTAIGKGQLKTKRQLLVALATARQLECRPAPAGGAWGHLPACPSSCCVRVGWGCGRWRAVAPVLWVRGVTMYIVL